MEGKRKLNGWGRENEMTAALRPHTHGHVQLEEDVPVRQFLRPSNARTRLTVVESRQARENTLTKRTDTPPTHTGRAELSFLRERAPVHTHPNAHGQSAHGKPPLQKTIPLQKNDHTAPALPPTGNIEKRDSVRIKVLNEGGWEIGKRETR